MFTCTIQEDFTSSDKDTYCYYVSVDEGAGKEYYCVIDCLTAPLVIGGKYDIKGLVFGLLTEKYPYIGVVWYDVNRDTTTSSTQKNDDTTTKPDTTKAPETEAVMNPIIVIDNDIIKISVTKVSVNSSYSGDEFVLTMLIENKSDYNVRVYMRNEALNGFMCDTIGVGEAAAHKKAYSTFTWEPWNLEKINITADDVTDVEFTLLVSDDTYPHNVNFEVPVTSLQIG